MSALVPDPDCAVGVVSVEELAKRQPTLAEALDAFIDETRGDPFPGLKRGLDGNHELWLETVRGVVVVIYLDTWSNYDPQWRARLDIAEQDFTVPLLDGPYVDREQSKADALPEIVSWMRVITNAQADRPQDAVVEEQPQACFDGVCECDEQCPRCGKGSHGEHDYDCLEV